MPKLCFVLLLVLGICLASLPALAQAEGIYLQDEAGNLAKTALPDKTVVMTFDDGPSVYTAEILDILRQKGVKATFFVVGSQAVQHPILQQIYEQGHEIGNHTYTHSDLSRQASWRTRLEINLTRIVIASQINHSTRLFRPSLIGTESLGLPAEKVVKRAADLGYVTAAVTVDSQDWRRPGTELLIANATSPEGGIILLHDGGGDRTQTVQALPDIIDYYKQHGFRFATVGEAFGIPRHEMMPAVSGADKVLALLAAAVFAVIAWMASTLKWLILVLIIASFSRFLLVTTAALIQSRRRFKGRAPEDLQCSILIPAYNESAVIKSCLKSVLASKYPHFEVLVIDDGSKDNTYEIASRIEDSRLRVLKKQNGGKATALNYGIAESKLPFIVAIDADTVFKPDTISMLIRHFHNPKVGAVSGNTKIVNRHKLITKLQSLEYIVGFNLDRRMGDLFDCITVVPGAIGAFRRSVLDQVGGFTFDTLAEDTDLTLSVKEAGHSVVYDSEAIALTEAPATVKDLLKQRFRWTFGTMQAVWKHKGSFLNPKRGSLGMIGLPYLVLFQIVFPLFSPLFDLVVIIGLLTRQYELIMVSFLVYTLADVITSAIALRLDNEKLRNLWVLIPQRILYRQLMYYVIVRSVVNVLKGRLVHWGKLERQGTHLAKS